MTPYLLILSDKICQNQRIVLPISALAIPLFLACLLLLKRCRQKIPPLCDVNEKCPTSPSPSDDVSCWICLAEGPDESGQPLRRDCSCRGESGFAHVSCIVEYAKAKSLDYIGRDVDKFREPWIKCTHCLQYYHNVLAVDLANEFVSTVEKKYPGNQLSLLVALQIQLQSMVKAEQNEGAELTADRILSMFREMRMVNSSLLTIGNILKIEGSVYDQLGVLALLEGSKESTKTAVEYFEKCRNISKAIGQTKGVIHSEAQIAHAKSKYEGGSKDGGLKKFQELYKEFVEQEGEESYNAICVGAKVANALRKSRRVIEAERLYTKLAAISHRVHGPDHDFTKDLESDLQLFNVRTVFINSQNEMKMFRALRYERDGERCVIQGPVINPINIQEEKVCTVATGEIYLALGTPVVCHGLERSKHLNGKIGDILSWDKETGRLGVHFEDQDLKPCLVKPGNIRILFELPDE